MDEHLTCINIFGGCKKKEKQTLAIWLMELETAMINRYPVTGHWCPSLPAIPHLCLVDWTEVLPRAKPSSILSVAKEKPQWSRWTRFSADDETILSNFQVPQEDEAIFWLHVYTGVWVLLSTGNIVGWEEEYFENHLNPTDVSTAWKLGKLPVNLQTGPVVDFPPQTGYQVPEGVLSLRSAALERSMPQIQGGIDLCFFTVVEQNTSLFSSQGYFGGCGLLTRTFGVIYGVWSWNIGSVK